MCNLSIWGFAYIAHCVGIHFLDVFCVFFQPPTHTRSSDLSRCQVDMWITVDTSVILRVKGDVCMYFGVKKLY